MNRFRLRTGILSLALLAATAGRAVHAQWMQPSPADLATGTDYYAAFMPNSDGSPTRFMGLYITSQFSTTGFVDIPGQGVMPFTVDRGKVTTVEIPRALEITAEEEASRGGIHIWSRAPVSIYAYNARSKSAAGYSVQPVSAWGTEYTVPSLPNNGSGQKTGELMIIAAGDSTALDISLPIPDRRGLKVLHPVLGPGDTYLVQASSDVDGGDLSGATIRPTHPASAKPFAVISGHVMAAVGNDPSTSDPAQVGAQASFQSTMLLPDSKLGQEYVSMPIRSNEGDRFRIVSLQYGTRVTLRHYRSGSGTPEVYTTPLLDIGEVFDISSSDGTPDGPQLTGPIEWSANYPFRIVQLRKSSSGIEGTPAMIELAPMVSFSSWSAFATPEKIVDATFTRHTLTVVARAATTEALRTLQFDGQPLVQTAPELLTQRIGSTNLYYATLPISSGGHDLVSTADAPFTATVSGTTADGDHYENVVPFLLPSVAADRDAPRILSSTGTRQITVEATDSTQSYFSGLKSVTGDNGTGWRWSTSSGDRYGNMTTTFTAIADPSGPLYALLEDYDGNKSSVKVSDGVCFKTAIPDVTALNLTTSQGTPDAVPVTFATNVCGDDAHIIRIDYGKGTAAQFITAVFEGGIGMIPAGSKARLIVTVPGTVEQGTYATILSVQIDDSTSLIPISVTVNGPAGVAAEESAEGALAASVHPNPFRGATTISLSRPLGRDASVQITDRLGRTVRDLSANAAAGRQTLLWDGTDLEGAQAPAGLYFVTIADGASRIVRGITLVR